MTVHGSTSSLVVENQKRLTALPGSPELLAEGRKGYQQLQEVLSQANLPAIEASLVDRITSAFCCSRFLARTLSAHPDWVTQECSEPLLRKPFTIERLTEHESLLHEAADDKDFMRQLRILRQREMMRIALRDLYSWADLNETMDALSKLAEFCVVQAHARAYRQQCVRYGQPVSEQGDVQSLVVLAMGKLGGGELNYSSDIDLIFAYPEAGQTRIESDGQRSTDNQSFFVAQAQALIRYLSEMTADGFVFRVDARLRPFGDSGALVVSFASMESYYQHQGRDWERYAMIKARPVCGMIAHQLQLEKLLQPFIYRRYLDYGAFTSLRDMKTLIMREVERKGLHDNVKLGSGGIREIEFTGQAFQLIRGGRDPELRCRQILVVLARLADRGILEQDSACALQAAYRFLRDTENRLQMVDDQQTHALPKEQLERQRLAYSMGYGDWPDFKAALERHRSAASNYFQGIFFAHEEPGTKQPDQCQLTMHQLLNGRLPDAEAVAALSDCGFSNADALFVCLRSFFVSNSFKNVTPLARNRLSTLLPMVLRQLPSVKNEERTLRRVLELLQAVMQRPVYLALLIEYPAALTQMMELFAASGWIADYLARQPILLDSLLDAEQLYYLPSREELLHELRQLIQTQAEEDPEQRLNALRHFKQEQTLRVAAVDVNEQLPLMKVSDQLTWLAEAILDQICTLSYEELVVKYGPPGCSLGGSDYVPEMAVVGYGKLGGIELGYGSDLDIVLLHNSAGELQQTRGECVIDNQSFFARLGQRLVYWLTTPTLAGILYETDLRLRPDGASGMLISSLERFQQYQAERAWIWEHQALVRARMVVGSSHIREEFERIRHNILIQQRDHKQLRKEVRNMRERMRKEIAKSRADEFDLKFDRGGLGDIEFLVQFGVLAWAYQYPELTRYTDNIRILEQFRTLGLFTRDEVNCLTEGYLQLRAQIHRRALGGEGAVIGDADVVRDYVDRVAEIWRKYMDVDE
ncbi:MAG: bifunctional [glutamate--ammonia ligase]-adenylyl-L-tyrosine phosphorylase/[glutamate--ammonia-ligase] adenylyltransferase [Gammaproteobacteria bacterium]|nr:bifunctional [glutamate--ammonia ligase]-adenylyl-L-tyrosine phosphorylase/[glutamate--ammonia-ligase] adenylyltransferase [Gammaproteobacteria bacterium]